MKQNVFRDILTQVPRKIQNVRVFRHIFTDVCLWLGLLLGRHSSDQLWMSALLAAGFAIFCFRSFSMMHECVHSASHSSRRWNDAIGAMYGIFCFLPFRSWREIHLKHHTWTGNVEKDPSARLLAEFRKNGFRTAGYVSWSWLNWIPTLAFLQHVVFWKATKSRSEAIFIGLSVATLLGAARALGPLTLLAGLIFYLYLVEIINFPHHLGMQQFDGEARFSAHDQAQFTRSCVYPKWFAHHVLLNFNLHTEHHLFPAHPWYALDAIHAKIKNEGLLQNACESNAWILKNRGVPIEQIMTQTFAEKERRSA